MKRDHLEWMLLVGLVAWLGGFGGALVKPWPTARALSVIGLLAVVIALTLDMRSSEGKADMDRIRSEDAWLRPEERYRQRNAAIGIVAALFAFLWLWARTMIGGAA